MFANIVKTLNKEQIKESQAYKVVNLMDKIFYYEADMKEKDLGKEDKIKKNSNEYQQVVKELNNKINSLKPYKDSPLDKAIKYWNNLKGEQWLYLTNCDLDIDNNEAERQVKKFVINRKNYLFSNNERGAKASCIILTLIDLGYINKLDPIEYVLNNVKSEDFESLLPWNIKKLKKIDNNQ